MNSFFSRRGFLKGLFCLLVLTGCDHSGKNGPAGAADAFFDLLAKGRVREAYESTAFALQAQITMQSFEATEKDLGLGNYDGRVWSVHSLKGKEAVLDGQISNKNGAKFQVRAVLIQDSGRWKLSTLLTPGPGGAGPLEDYFTRIGRGSEMREITRRSVPSDREIKAMIAETMKKFNESLHKKNFTDFYKDVAGGWQAQTSRTDMERAFKPLLDAGTTIDAAENASPVLDEPPRINSDGMLLVRGRYPTLSHPVIFGLKYTYELPQWRLMGITLTVQ